MKQQLLTTILYFSLIPVSAQDDLPQDYLSKEFHAGRREAARQMMPDNSVMVVFSYPKETTPMM